MTLHDYEYEHRHVLHSKIERTLIKRDRNPDSATVADAVDRHQTHSSGRFRAPGRAFSSVAEIDSELTHLGVTGRGFGSSAGGWRPAVLGEGAGPGSCACG
jgi:hypothetical protein